MTIDTAATARQQARNLYWGAMPLPVGAQCLGLRRDLGDMGAVLLLASGAYVQGNAGAIRVLDEYEVPRALLANVQERHGLTNKAMAEQLGVDERTVERYRQGVRQIRGPAAILVRQLCLQD
jgi:hypothetical protein